MFSRYYGFKDGKAGSLSNNIYRGTEILSITTLESGKSCHYKDTNIGCMTTIDFKSAPADLSDIKVKINGNVYTFQRGYDASWGCNDKIFTTSGTYTIEFLN